MTPIFYKPEMVVSNNESYSESAGKPEKVVLDWLSRVGIREHISVKDFLPISAETIKQCHDQDS